MICIGINESNSKVGFDSFYYYFKNFNFILTFLKCSGNDESNGELGFDSYDFFFFLGGGGWEIVLGLLNKMVGFKSF